MERRSCFLNTPSTPHLDGDQQNQTHGVFLLWPAKIKQEKKHNGFTSIPTIFLHTGEWFPCLLSQPVTNDRAHTPAAPPRPQHDSDAALTSGMCSPQAVFLILLGHFHVGQREEPFLCTVLWTEIPEAEESVGETTTGHLQLSSTTWELGGDGIMQWGEGTPAFGGRGKFSDRKSRGSSCCPQKNPPPNSVFFPVECGWRAAPLTQQV